MRSELIHVKLLKRFLTPGKHSVRVCVWLWLLLLSLLFYLKLKK